MSLYKKTLIKKKPNLIQKVIRKILIKIEACYGVDFYSVNSVEELGLDQELVSKCSPSGNRYLFKMLLNLQIGKNDSILDVGCGKGSAIRIFSKFNFNKTDGVELSTELSNIARENFKKIKNFKPVIYTENILNFNLLNNYNFFYLYNPFPSSVFKEFLKCLNTQIYQKKIYIIYNNPICHDLLISDGFEFIKQYPDMWGNGINIYQKEIE